LQCFHLKHSKVDPETFAGCYVSTYVANEAIIGACFGDPERDEMARTMPAKAFSEREIIMLQIDAIANGGAAYIVSRSLCQG
jgi:agmatine/peptidylarginine deiminase